MQPGDDEIRGVLARAQEIQNETPARYADYEHIIQAAEEVGIPRSAIERALRERMLLPQRLTAVGELTFARSADDKFYVAEVLSLAGDDVRVRFLRGSEHNVQLDELRPASFLPGERIICSWPWWGPWTCTVLSYDASRRRVTVTDGWGETRDFSLDEVWIAPRAPTPRRRARIYAALLGAGATAGAAIGALVTALLLR